MYLSEYCQQFILIFLCYMPFQIDWMEFHYYNVRICASILRLFWSDAHLKNHLLHFLGGKNTVSSVLWWEEEEEGAIKYAISHQDRDTPIFTTRTLLGWDESSMVFCKSLHYDNSIPPKMGYTIWRIVSYFFRYRTMPLLVPFIQFQNGNGHFSSCWKFDTCLSFVFLRWYPVQGRYAFWNSKVDRRNQI